MRVVGIDLSACASVHIEPAGFRNGLHGQKNDRLIGLGGFGTAPFSTSEVGWQEGDGILGEIVWSVYIIRARS